MSLAEPRERDSHIWARETHEHYVEEPWVSKRLFEEWPFDGQVFDPCCGFGHIVQSATDLGHVAWGHDIEDRWDKCAAVLDFLEPGRTKFSYENVVCNPPFDIIEEFTKEAVSRSLRNSALIFPTRRLNAAGSWLKTLPLVHIYYLTPRPSMPPGHVYRALEAQGKRPSGGTQDFAWLIFKRGFRGAPTAGWLHRDAPA